MRIHCVIDYEDINFPEIANSMFHVTTEQPTENGRTLPFLPEK